MNYFWFSLGWLVVTVLTGIFFYRLGRRDEALYSLKKELERRK